jgi:hypothetical protein
MNSKIFVLRNLSKHTLTPSISRKYFSSQNTNKNILTEFLHKTGIVIKKSPNRRRPETFVGDLQEILKLAPNNINAFFFSWSIVCRAATGLLVLLLL